MQLRKYEGALVDWAAAVRQISPLERRGGGARRGGRRRTRRAATLAEWSADASAPASPTVALSMLGMFLHLRGNYSEAMMCYDRALELQPNAIDVLLKRSSLWFEQEDTAKAFDDFNAALEWDKGHADIYCHRGQLHMLQSDLAKALTDLKKSVELDSESLLAHIQLGMAHHRLKQPAEARAIFQLAERRFADSPDALNYHGEFLVESGDLAGARTNFEKALAVSGGSYALAHVNLGILCLHEKQDIHGAIAKCQEAVAADPLCETAHVHMAHLQLQNSDLRAAVAAFDEAIALLRVKTELEEACGMREAAAAQVKLLTENPKLYEPAMARQRAQAAAMMQAQMAGQM